MVLVVDDHEDSRYLLQRMLALEGYEGKGVSCGTEALEYLATETPSLVILDFNMPDMNGLTVFAEMRKNPRLKQIPVIMFSANDGWVKEEALAAGVDGYVVKGSLDWAALHRQIVRLIGPGASRPQAAHPKPRSKDVS